jgi:hypothetical protein
MRIWSVNFSFATLIEVQKGEGIQNFFIMKKSLFSQKAIVEIKNPLFH